MEERSLESLRKRCKEHGITMRKQTLSWGPHVSFEIEGKRISESGVYTPDFVERNKVALNALDTIRRDHMGITHNGEKVYGI